MNAKLKAKAIASISPEFKAIYLDLINLERINNQDNEDCQGWIDWESIVKDIDFIEQIRNKD